MMTVRDASVGTAGGWEYSVRVQPDRTYIVRIYIENSSIYGVGELASLDTRVMVNLPTCTGNVIASNGFVSSSNAFPHKIWGGITFQSDEEFNLAYVEGSASLTTNAHPEGVPIGSEFLTSMGSMLGYETLDGVVLPGYEYSMYFTFEVRPQFAEF